MDKKDKEKKQVSEETQATEEAADVDASEEKTA